MSTVKFKDEDALSEAGLVVDPATNEAVPLLVGMTTAVNKRCATFLKLLGAAQAEVVGIGQDLIAIRAHIQERKVPGGFDGWLSRDFRWSRSQAYRFIDIANEFGDCPNLGHYDQSAMYRLAAPGTPMAAREEARQLADSGEFVDYTTAALIIDRHKGDTDKNEQDEIEEDSTSHVEDDGNDDPDNNGVSQDDDEEDKSGQEGDDRTEQEEADHEETESTVQSRRRKSGKAQGQDVRRNFRAPNLESKVWSPEKEHYRMEFKKLLTGGGHCQNNIVISDLSRQQLDILRHQIDDALAGKVDLTQNTHASRCDKTLIDMTKTTRSEVGKPEQRGAYLDPSDDESYFP